MVKSIVHFACARLQNRPATFIDLSGLCYSTAMPKHDLKISIPTFIRLLIVVLVTVTATGVQAGDNNTHCLKSSSTQSNTFDKLSRQYQRCRTLREKEYRNISYKRDRYLRLIHWATELNLGDSLREYIEGLREYDIFIGVKTNNFHSCIASLPNFSPLDQTNCDSQENRLEQKIGALTSNLKACRSCGLAKIPSGINDSAIELLVVQQKNARKIRESLFQKFSKNRNLELASKYPWQVVRDVFLPFVTDASLKLSNSQPMIVILGQLELSSASMDSFNQSTDDIISVYSQLEKTLDSDDDELPKQSEIFWKKYTQAIQTYQKNNLSNEPAGIDNADVFTRYIQLNKSNFQDNLAPLLDIAVNKYQVMRHKL